MGEIQPNLQREFPIVALGSVWRDGGGGRHVPVLGCGGAGRRLSLGWFEFGWDDGYRFLGVRK